MKPLTMAWRNVWRNSRRTLATVAATSFGLLMMIFYSGLVSGYLAGLESNIVDLEMGDVQVHHPDYREHPSLHRRIDDPAGVLARLDAAGLQAAPRLLGSGLAAAGEASAGVRLVGLDVARDSAVSKVSSRVAEGTWLDAAVPSQVVIGRKLAESLGLSVGDELVVLSQGADGSMANDLYTVGGVLGVVSEGVDRAGLFMGESAFRELMAVPQGAHQIIVRRGETSLDDAAAQVTEAAPDLETKTWRELNPTLASMLDTTEGAMIAMFIIVYLAIAIVILNAMLMAVFERIREFGVLKALGVGPGGVMSLIMLETLVQTTIAIAIGVVLSIPLNWYMTTTGIDLSQLGNVSVAGVAMDPIWRARVSVDTYVQPIVTLVVIVGLAVIYPALRAAFIKPIEAMRSS